MDISSPTHPHDAFVRQVMSDLRVAREFFTVHLPEDIKQQIDLNVLQLQPRSHINEVRKEAIVDLLYKTKLQDGEEAYLYLIVEHQSSADELMAFRILKYTCNIMEDHLQKTKTKKLPLVYPLVIYHAPRVYPYSTDIKDLVAGPRELIDRYFLKPFHLIDLGRVSDEELKSHPWVGIMELALKHIFSKNLMAALRGMAEPMRGVVILGGENYVSIVLEYVLDRGDIKNKQDFFELINEQISTEVGEKIMTLREQFIEEGFNRGKLEGKHEGKLEGKHEAELALAKKLLAAGLELRFVAEMTNLSLEKLALLN